MGLELWLHWHTLNAVLLPQTLNLYDREKTMTLAEKKILLGPFREVLTEQITESLVLVDSTMVYDDDLFTQLILGFGRLGFNTI